MTIATNQPMTLEEYLNYDDGTDARYELVDGVLVEMGAESDVNVLIASFLFSVFLEFVPFNLIRRGTGIQVEGSQANTRFPDLMVLTEDCAAALAGRRRSLITLEMPTPALVIEMVSSSDTNEPLRERNYVQKRREYAQRGIGEYWLVDAIAGAVLVLNLVNQEYQEQRFVGDERLVSEVFTDLDVSAAQVLQVG